MRNRNLMLGAAGIVIVVAVALVLTNPSTPCCAEGSAEAVQDISPAAYQEQFAVADAAHLLIDVRTPEEFASGHISGAVNIPVDSLSSRLSEVPQGQPLVVYCRSGNRSATASEILADAGYSSIYDMGGLTDWTARGFPVE